MVPRPRLTPPDVACWVLKTAAPPETITPGWVPGAVVDLDRCVRPSYRLGLLRPGQPCALWLSGRCDPGVHAVGVVTALPTLGGPEGPVVSPAVGVRLLRLQRPLPRADLLRTATFADAEVLRMPAGSNPSYLTPAQFTALRAAIDGEEQHRAGWCGAQPRQDPQTTRTTTARGVTAAPRASVRRRPRGWCP